MPNLDEFVGVTLLVYGLLIALWCGNEVAIALRLHAARRANGEKFSQSDFPREYWRSVARDGALCAWGIAWVIVGVVEFVRPATFG